MDARKDVLRVCGWIIQKYRPYGLYLDVVGHFHWTMFEPKAKLKTKEFLRHIKVLGQDSSDKVIDGFQETEKELMQKFIADTQDLIDHNEWGVGLENLLSNLYEIEFPLDRKAVDLAKDVIKECKMDFGQWTFIEELVK